MKKSHLHLRLATGGFTLIELLVAISILAVMMLAVAEMSNSTSTITVGGFKHMDADTEARTALDRMSFDIARMVKRTDVDYYFPTTADTGNTSDQMAFFSESSGYYPSTMTAGQGGSVSLVGYRINSSNQFERLSKGLPWNGAAGGSAMIYLPQTITGTTGTWSDVAAQGTDTDYHVFGDQIFRMELTYLVQNSFTNPSTTKGQGKADSGTNPKFSNYPNVVGVNAKGVFNPQEVQAIIVSIAVLDARSQAILQTGELAKAASDLASVDDTSLNSGTNPSANLPVTKWQNALDSALASTGSAIALDIPRTAAAQIRFYQRYCYLNPAPQN